MGLDVQDTVPEWLDSDLTDPGHKSIDDKIVSNA